MARSLQRVQWRCAPSACRPFLRDRTSLRQTDRRSPACEKSLETSRESPCEAPSARRRHHRGRAGYLTIGGDRCSISAQNLRRMIAGSATRSMVDLCYLFIASDVKDDVCARLLGVCGGKDPAMKVACCQKSTRAHRATLVRRREGRSAGCVVSSYCGITTV